MTAKCLVALLFIFNVQFTSATPLCPLPYFTPTDFLGGAFSGQKLTEYNFTRSGEDSVFEYFEYQTVDPGYQSVYLVDILRAEDASYRVALGRLPKQALVNEKDAPEFRYRMIDVAIVNRLVKAATPILLHTHYNPVRQDIVCTDGFVVQVYLVARGYGDLVADAYSPPSGSEARSVVELGRVLKQFVLGKADEAAIDATLLDVESHGTQSAGAN
jgi:hypothetical protein